MNNNIKIELPEVIDDTMTLLNIIKIYDKEGNKIEKIKSLNTKTLESEQYLFDFNNRVIIIDDVIQTHKIQLEDITLVFKQL